MQENGAYLLFSPDLIPGLRSIRGVSWQELIDHVAHLDQLAIDRLAFILLMVQLNGCSSCQGDSYKAMRGCLLCSQQTVKRFRGSDQNILDKYEESKMMINQYLNEESNDKD